ncbi:MAG: 2OG-Fe(II) oxygenase [Bacteriovoracaceae bacterium]|nr:2OG-Fe(II) oxygenase [Bacteriovoracaceae bacterium]
MKEFLRNGFTIINIELPDKIKDLVLAEKWTELDSKFGELLSPGGLLFKKLSDFETFQEIERIIAIREAPDDEGIWHDDGSRKLAFSLSLTINPELVEGGVLHFRKRNSDDISKIPTLCFGSMIVFQTGQNDFEHRISSVKKGRRTICAGWCT